MSLYLLIFFILGKQLSVLAEVAAEQERSKSGNDGGVSLGERQK